MRLAQLADNAIGPILVCKETQAPRPAWKEISHLNAAYKVLWSQWDRLEIRGGLLFRRYIATPPQPNRWQLLVPKAKQREVFQHLHEHNTAGHMGGRRTLERAKLAFFWPRMRENIEAMCRACSRCAARKPAQRTNRAPLQQYLVGEPLERIAIDILGPLPKTRRGNRFVVVIADYFTKWAEAFALPDQEAITVAKVVVEEFVCRFGTPRQLHTDRGSNFESHLFQEVCRLLNIDKTRTTSRRPQSDGMVERFNRTLATMLTMYAEKDQRSWDEHLPYVMLAYRSSVHDSTGFSPNRMMLGREVELPLQTVVGMPEPEEQYTDPGNYVDLLQERLVSAHEEARKHLKRSAIQQKRYYDHRACQRPQFAIGDPVWLYNPTQRKGVCRKLTSQWKGPYVVTQQLGDVNYMIQRSARKPPFMVHMDKLKVYEGEDPPQWFRNRMVQLE